VSYAAVWCCSPLLCALILLGLLAEIEKFMRHAMRVIPRVDYHSGRLNRGQGSGWLLQGSASQDLSVVRYNHDKRFISDFSPDRIKYWKSRAKDARINKPYDLARGDKPPFLLRHAFEAYSLKKQGYELKPSLRMMKRTATSSWSLSCCRLILKPRSRTQNQLSRRSSASIEHRWPVG
jgi:hypothetical protein